MILSSGIDVGKCHGFNSRIVGGVNWVARVSLQNAAILVLNDTGFNRLKCPPRSSPSTSINVSAFFADSPLSHQPGENEVSSRPPASAAATASSRGQRHRESAPAPAPAPVPVRPSSRAPSHSRASSSINVSAYFADSPASHHGDEISSRPSASHAAASASSRQPASASQIDSLLNGIQIAINAVHNAAAALRSHLDSRLRGGQSQQSQSTRALTVASSSSTRAPSASNDAAWISHATTLSTSLHQTIDFADRQIAHCHAMIGSLAQPQQQHRLLELRAALFEYKREELTLKQRVRYMRQDLSNQSASATGNRTGANERRSSSRRSSPSPSISASEFFSDAASPNSLAESDSDCEPFNVSATALKDDSIIASAATTARTGVDQLSTGSADREYAFLDSLPPATSSRRAVAVAATSASTSSDALQSAYQSKRYEHLARLEFVATEDEEFRSIQESINSVYTSFTSWGNTLTCRRNDLQKAAKHQWNVAQDTWDGWKTLLLDHEKENRRLIQQAQALLHDKQRAVRDEMRMNDAEWLQFIRHELKTVKNDDFKQAFGIPAKHFKLTPAHRIVLFSQFLAQQEQQLNQYSEYTRHFLGLKRSHVLWNGPVCAGSRVTISATAVAQRKHQINAEMQNMPKRAALRTFMRQLIDKCRASRPMTEIEQRQEIVRQNKHQGAIRFRAKQSRQSKQKASGAGSSSTKESAQDTESESDDSIAHSDRVARMSTLRIGSSSSQRPASTRTTRSQTHSLPRQAGHPYARPESGAATASASPRTAASTRNEEKSAASSAQPHDALRRSGSRSRSYTRSRPVNDSHVPIRSVAANTSDRLIRRQETANGAAVASDSGRRSDSKLAGGSSRSRGSASIAAAQATSSDTSAYYNTQPVSRPHDDIGEEVSSRPHKRA